MHPGLRQGFLATEIQGRHCSQISPPPLPLLNPIESESWHEATFVSYKFSSTNAGASEVL